MNVRKNGQEFVVAEGASHGENWSHPRVPYEPGDDWQDSMADFVRRVVVATPPRGEYEYGPSFE
jgi:hypothetical protein